MSHTRSGWVGGGGWFTMPVDTGNQVMCTVGQTDGHNSPDYTTSRADVQWDRIEPKLPINAPQGPHMVYYGPS